MSDSPSDQPKGCNPEGSSLLVAISLVVVLPNLQYKGLYRPVIRRHRRRSRRATCKEGRLAGSCSSQSTLRPRKGKNYSRSSKSVLEYRLSRYQKDTQQKGREARSPGRAKSGPEGCRRRSTLCCSYFPNVILSKTQYISSLC